MYEVVYQYSLPKISIDLCQLYAYSDIVIFLLYTWNIFFGAFCLLCIISWTLVEHVMMLNEFLLCVTIMVTSLFFGLCGDNFVYRLAIAHACAAFREHQKHVSRDRVAFVSSSRVYCYVISFIVHVLLSYFALCVAIMFYCYLVCSYLCLGTINQCVHHSMWMLSCW